MSVKHNEYEYAGPHHENKTQHVREKYKKVYTEAYITGIVQEQYPLLHSTLRFFSFNRLFTANGRNKFIREYGKQLKREQ